MRLRPLAALAPVLLAAVTVAATAAPASAESPPAVDGQVEWKAVFSENGTITRMPVRLPAEAPLRAQELSDVNAAAVTPIQETGPSANRFDLVIIGDGYTSGQQGLLRQHANAAWQAVANSAPWDRNRSGINVWVVEVVSSQSGVDNDPTQGVNRATALDMGFWCSGIERLLCLNESKAQAYARQAPGVDAIIAVGNSTKYGGAGYPSLSTASGGNASSAQITLHELGHSVGGLADEYWSPGTRHPGGEPQAPNVTANSSGAKWSSYLGRATPDGGVIGAYEGGNYVERGIWRPSENSLMRNIGRPFNLIGLDVMDRAIKARIR